MGIWVFGDEGKASILDIEPQKMHTRAGTLYVSLARPNPSTTSTYDPISRNQVLLRTLRPFFSLLTSPMS